MKTKKPIWRAIFFIVLALLILAYPLYWFVEIETTPVDADKIDPSGLLLATAIILAPFYYGFLWLATLVYETLLYAFKKITKRSFLLSLSVLFGILITVSTILLISSLAS